MGLIGASADWTLYVAFLGVAMQVVAVILFVSGKSISRSTGKARLTGAGAACGLLFAAGFGLAIASQYIGPRPQSSRTVASGDEPGGSAVDTAPGPGTAPATGLAPDSGRPFAASDPPAPWSPGYGIPLPGSPSATPPAVPLDEGQSEGWEPDNSRPIAEGSRSSYSGPASSKREVVAFGQTEALSDIARVQRDGPPAESAVSLARPSVSATVIITAPAADRPRLAALLPGGTTKPLSDALREAGGISSLVLAERLVLVMTAAAGRNNLLYTLPGGRGTVSYLPAKGQLTLSGAFAGTGSDGATATVYDQEMRARRPAEWPDLAGARLVFRLYAVDVVGSTGSLRRIDSAVLSPESGPIVLAASGSSLALSTKDATYQSMMGDHGASHQWTLPAPWASLSRRLTTQ